MDGQPARTGGPEHRDRLSSVADIHSDGLDPLEKDVVCDTAFEPGEGRSRAHVRPASEREVISGAREVKSEGIGNFVDSLVTVRRRQTESNLGSFLDGIGKSWRNDSSMTVGTRSRSTRKRANRPGSEDTVSSGRSALSGTP